MKAYRYILISFFQESFFVTINMLVSIILFFLGTLLILNNPAGVEKRMLQAFIFMLFAACSLSFTAAEHFQALVKNTFHMMLPDYRKRLTQVMAVMMLFVIIYPVTMLVIIGYTFLKTLALFTGISALIFWGLYFSKANPGALVFILLPGKALYDALGFKSKTRIFGLNEPVSLFGSLDAFAGLIILVSVASLVLFVYLFHNYRFSERKADQIKTSDPYLKEFDWSNRLIDKVAFHRLGKATTNSGKNSRSRSKKVDLCEFALFSPGYSTVVNIVIGAVGMVLLWYLYEWILRSGQVTDGRLEYFIYFALHFIFAGMMTIDFLQHRGRFSFLWMMPVWKSRADFAWTVLLAYLKVIFKNFLVLMVLLFIIGKIVTSIQVLILVKLTLILIPLILFLLGMSLYFMDSVNTPEAKGWMIFVIMTAMLLFIIMAITFKPILSNNGLFSIVVLSGLLFAWLMLRRGYRELKETELNYTSPDM